MKRLLLALLIGFSMPSYAQEFNQQVLNAFSASYASESAKDYGKAITDLQPAYSEGFYEINLRLGWLNYLLKQYTASEKYYRQAMKLKPSSIEAMFGYINPVAAELKWADVFMTYQKVLAVDPNHSLANYRIALMYYYRKEFATAEKHLQKIVERYPFDYDIVLLLAQTKLALGKTSESKAYYQRALIYSPNNSEIKSVLSKM